MDFSKLLMREDKGGDFDRPGSAMFWAGADAGDSS